MAKQEKGTKSTGNSSIVFQRIIQKTNVRTKKDMTDYTRAVNQAENKENPKRLLLYNLFDVIRKDMHLKGLIKLSLFMLMSKPFRVVNASTKVEDTEKTEFLRHKWFFTFMRHYVETDLYGHSLLQITDFDEMGNAVIKLIPRRHVIPEWKCYLIDQADDAKKGIDYTPLINQFLIELGEEDDLGFMESAAPDILFKKNAKIAWSEFVEIFGLDTRVGETNSRNSKDIDRMEEALINAAKSQYMILQAGEKLSFQGTQRTDAYMVFDKFMDRINSEVSKGYLSNTMTTDNGSSRSQGEVHERVTEAFAKAQALSFSLTTNSDLFTLLKNQGIDWTGFKFEFVDTYVSPEQAEIDFKLFDRFEIPEDFFVKKYNVTITGVKDRSKLPAPEAPTKANKSNNSILKLHAALHELYTSKHSH
ncbi:MAG TPA: DUF935 family protein [Bacteroidia bacterium]|nr:DUF935 family protein [Bacteroidia bacterium]